MRIGRYPSLRPELCEQCCSADLIGSQECCSNLHTSQDCSNFGEDWDSFVHVVMTALAMWANIFGHVNEGQNCLCLASLSSGEKKNSITKMNSKINVTCLSCLVMHMGVLLF